MCGLAGVAGKGILQRDLDNLRTLLYISVERGYDSTGVAAIRTSRGNHIPERITLSKKAVPAWEYLEEEFGNKNGPFGTTLTDALIGHVRWATVGKVDEGNAHPFENEGLVGAHNGTLYNPEFRQEGITDSELLLNKIAEEGLVDTLEELSPKSAYALTIYEKNSGKLYFTRNSERTLFVGVHKKRDVLYWASEERFLNFLKEDLEIYYFSPWKVYEVPIENIKADNHSPWEIYDLTDKSKEVDKFHQEHNKKENERLLKKYGGYSGTGYGGFHGHVFSHGAWDYEDFWEEREKKKKKEKRKKKVKLGDDASWENYLDQVEEEENPPFEIECVSCAEIIDPSELSASRIWYDNSQVHLCGACRNVMRDLHNDEDTTGTSDTEDVTVHTH